MQSGIDSSRLRIAQETVTPTSASPAKPTEMAEAKGFFNEGGPSFRDVLDAINPLNHIPVVSDILEDQTGHHVSMAARLAGGAILGGPIGFATSLATEIFTGFAGASPAKAVYAAITGDNTKQVAANTVQTTASPQELASLAPAADAAAMAAPVDDVMVSDTAAPAGKGNPVLDLYGASTSAHSSYKKAQLLPYLRDVNHSKVI